MNPCVLDTHGAMVALATERPKRILSPVFFPVRTTHRRQGGALWARRYAKDRVGFYVVHPMRGARKGGMGRRYIA
jgi:hypothetical protein